MISKMYPRSNRMSMRWILVPVLIVVALIATLIGTSLYFQSVFPSSYFGPPFFGWWFGGPFFGWIIFIPLVFLAFFAFRLFFWRSWGCGWPSRQYYDPALETLRQRYARGEITKEQFEQLTKDLEQQ